MLTSRSIIVLELEYVGARCRTRNIDVDSTGEGITSQRSINRLSEEVDAIATAVMDNYYSARMKVDDNDHDPSQHHNEHIVSSAFVSWCCLRTA